MRTRLPAALVLVALVVAACASGAGSGGQLEGTEWILRSYLQDGSLLIVPETQYADAAFAADRVKGFAGCNDYDAVVRSGDRALLVSQAVVTRKACAEDAMAFETAYLGLLDQSRFYSARSDTLTIFDGSATAILVFDAAPRNPLLGRWNVDSFETAPGTVSAVLEGTTLDVVFGIGSVGGNAGCNDFTGTYGTNGDLVRIGPLATTRKACADDVMTQEAAFLAALQGTSMVEQRAGTLNLTDLSGSLKVALARPAAAEAAGPSPTPATTEGPTPTPSPTPKPTEKPTPTASPTPRPTEKPTEKPTAAPTGKPTATPAASPSAAPTVASCALLTVDAVQVATIAYPGTWYTTTAPPDVACRYFDPAPITVPADPSTLQAVVMASTTATSYADAVAAATNPSAWDVAQQQQVTLDGLDATLVAATATSDTAGVAVGTSTFGYLVDVGSAGTVTLWTTGTSTDPGFANASALVTLMAQASQFVAPAS
jgi:heat shock protein HslJ